MEKNKVVIIDDDRMILHALKREIQAFSISQQLELYLFIHPQEALEFLNNNKTVNLLITDQRMPVLSGYELIAKARKSIPDISAILLTAYSDLDGMKKSINAGIVSYIGKPWSRYHLIRELSRGLDINKMKRIQRKYILKISRELQASSKGHDALMFHHQPHSDCVKFSLVSEANPPFNSSSFFHCQKIDEKNILYIFGDVGVSGIWSASKSVIIKTLIVEILDGYKDIRLFSASEMMDELNKRIYRHLGALSGDRISCSVLHFDLAFRNLTVASGGNMSHFILRSPALINQEIQGPPLGAHSDSHYEDIMIAIQNTDRILLYTYGLEEVQRVFGILNQLFIKFQSEEDFLNCVMEELKVSLKGKRPLGDYSILSLKLMPETIPVE